MRMRLVVLGSLAAMAMVVGGPLGAGAITGEFFEVQPPIPNGFLSGSDVNDAGQSTGYADFGGSGNRAFLRDADGTYTELDPVAGDTFSQGRALNESGDVVGGSGSHAVLWEGGGAPLDLGALPGHTDSFAEDINDDGWIVGTSNGGGAYRAWARDPSGGPLIDMGTISGSTVVQVAAMNNAGVAVGRALVAGEFLPWRWTEAGGIEPLPLPDGEVSFEPDDINASGRIVGHVFEFIAPEGVYRAYVYDGVGYEALEMDGYDSSFPHGINDEGLAVGFLDLQLESSRRPAAWDTITGATAAFALFEDAAFTNELNAVNNSGLAIGISREGDDLDRTWMGIIGPDVEPTDPAAPPAEPAPAAPSFTG
jgi:hypothetical protein